MTNEEIYQHIIKRINELNDGKRMHDIAIRELEEVAKMLGDIECNKWMKKQKLAKPKT